MTERSLLVPADRDPPVVLVVDDEPSVRRMFIAALERGGYQALGAATGAQARELVDRHAVDLVLLDRSMPDIASEELLRQMRSDPRTARVPVLFVTGDADLDRKLEALAAGANDYLVKPLALDELLARVGAQLEDRARWQDHLADTLTARSRRSNELAAFGPELPLRDLGSALLSVLAREFPVTAVRILPVRYDEDRPAAATRFASVEPATTVSVQGRTTWIRVPLRSGADVLGILEVVAEGPSDELVAASLDLAPQIASLSAVRLRRTVAGEQAQRWIRGLVEDGGLLTVYQPVVTLPDRVTVGVEGLSRFADGTPPEVAFRSAAGAGVAGDLEVAAVRRLVADAGALQTDAWLSLNVSAATLLSGRLEPSLVGADRPIVLEITEHEHIDDYQALRAHASRLAGVRLAVDDAGAGHASLRHVFELEPDLIKLDRTWVAAIDGDPVRQALIRGMVGFAQAMSATIIGEGIEREAEAQTLASLGVPLGQGYLLGRPAPAGGA